jgi:hypothetical protein
MKKFKSMLVVGMLAVMSFAFTAEDVLARRSGGGGFKSSPRSAPRSAPRVRTAPKVRRAPKATPAKKRTTQKRTATAPKRTAAQQKSFETAKKNGTSFKTKSAASTAFKQKHYAKYPAKYASKPATRPAHVPQSTSVGGVNYNVSYNAGYGGYGYMGAGGRWMMYDAMTDVIMLNMLMSRNHYIVDTVAPAPVVRVRRANTGRTIFIVLGSIVAVIVIGSIVIGQSRQ